MKKNRSSKSDEWCSCVRHLPTLLYFMMLNSFILAFLLCSSVLHGHQVCWVLTHWPSRVETGIELRCSYIVSRDVAAQWISHGYWLFTWHVLLCWIIFGFCSICWTTSAYRVFLVVIRTYVTLLNGLTKCNQIFNVECHYLKQYIFFPKFPQGSDTEQKTNFFTALLEVYLQTRRPLC